MSRSSIRGSDRPRIALYSHDTMGLGHVRRNLLIGRELAKSDLQPNVLLLSGAVEAKSFYLPIGVDLVTLPSLFKEEDGQYRSRRLRLALPELVSLRREILQATIAAFDPDLLIVDTAPWGVAGELDSTLQRLTEEKRTRVVLGMRDVWDEPSVISKEWAGKKNWEAIRNHYDQVWVYGDPSVYDVIREYEIVQDLANKFRYTGYLGRMGSPLFDGVFQGTHNPDLGDAPFVLCLMGGGQDGMRLAEAFLEADLPANLTGLLVTGPFMDPSDLRRLRAHAKVNPRMKIVEFLPEPISYVEKADFVVSMGGYNAVCEILSFRKRALIVPRVVPRKEQFIRAERLSALGVLNVLSPDELESKAITSFLQGGSEPVHAIPFDMDGLAKVLDLARSLIRGDIPLQDQTRARGHA